MAEGTPAMAPVLAAHPEAQPLPALRRPPWWRGTIARRSVCYVALFGGAFLVHAYVVKPFVIPSSSMVPTIKPRDRLLVNQLSYRFHGVRRGDIVVLDNPEADRGPEEGRLLKRVIGLPGESVLSRGGRVVVDGRRLREPYLPAGVDTTGLEPVIVPAGHYLVLGDNREDSEDGRIFGPIPKSSIVGRAFLRVWPLRSFASL